MMNIYKQILPLEPTVYLYYINPFCVTLLTLHALKRYAQMLNVRILLATQLTSSGLGTNLMHTRLENAMLLTMGLA